MISNQQTEELVKKWQFRAKKQMKCADNPKTPEIGKRVMVHGAMVYFNCSEELQKLNKSNSFFSLVFGALKQKLKRP